MTACMSIIDCTLIPVLLETNSHLRKKNIALPTEGVIANKLRIKLKNWQSWCNL
jgi:hypothetical protein